MLGCERACREVGREGESRRRSCCIKPTAQGLTGCLYCSRRAVAVRIEHAAGVSRSFESGDTHPGRALQSLPVGAVALRPRLTQGKPIIIVVSSPACCAMPAVLCRAVPQQSNGTKVMWGFVPYDHIFGPKGWCNVDAGDKTMKKK